MRACTSHERARSLYCSIRGVAEYLRAVVAVVAAVVAEVALVADLEVGRLAEDVACDDTDRTSSCFGIVQ